MKKTLTISDVHNMFYNYLLWNYDGEKTIIDQCEHDKDLPKSNVIAEWHNTFVKQHEAIDFIETCKDRTVSTDNLSWLEGEDLLLRNKITKIPIFINLTKKKVIKDDEDLFFAKKKGMKLAKKYGYAVCFLQKRSDFIWSFKKKIVSL